MKCHTLRSSVGVTNVSKFNKVQVYTSITKKKRQLLPNMWLGALVMSLQMTKRNGSCHCLIFDTFSSEERSMADFKSLYVIINGLLLWQYKRLDAQSKK